MKNIERAAEFVLLMDKQLKNQLFVVNGEVQGKKLWENTFIKHQLDKRDAGDKFSVGDIFVQWCIRCCPSAHSGAD